MNKPQVLATVAGVEITEEDVQAYILKLPREQQAYASNPSVHTKIVEQLIALQMFAQEAMEEKLDETPEFKKIMADTKRDFLAQMKVQKIVEDVRVTDDEAENYYNTHKEQFKKGESVGAKHILVDSEDKCQDILNMIRNDEKSFEDAAKEFSTCPSGKEGGDLGEFGRGQMVPEFDKAAFEAEVDKVVGPVQTQFGYHLIKVYKKSSGEIMSFADKKAEIIDRMIHDKQNEAYNKAVTALREKYMG